MNEISRGTKCLGAYSRSHRCLGGFPNGFLSWIKKQGWWRENRCYLCAGAVQDEQAIRVDVRQEMNPTFLEDARATSIPDESVDWVMIDPPYTRELAKSLYGTEDHYGGINSFTKEAARICRPGGLILTLSYEIPKRIPGCDFIAVWGIYQVPAVSYMRCLTVSARAVKEGK
ncbi:MAG: hypothetical protein WC455_17765 [Dehalococcoidia bacterium]|jgi:hypothetical protein